MFDQLITFAAQRFFKINFCYTLSIKWCHTCYSFHDPKIKCFVQAIEPKYKPYWLVFFDFESCTYLPVIESLDDEEPAARFHAVNCVSAMIFCSECTNELDLSAIHANSTTNVNSNCLCRKSNCAERRMITWINDVDGCVDSLDSFITWLFNGIGIGLERPHTTYVIGHYCGRFFHSLNFICTIENIDMICTSCWERSTEERIWLRKLYAAAIKFLC